MTVKTMSIFIFAMCCPSSVMSLRRIYEGALVQMHNHARRIDPNNVLLAKNENSEVISSENDETNGRCAFDQMCGRNCIGTAYGGKRYSEEVKQFMESLDPQKAKVWSFGLGGDVSFEIGLSCKYQFTIHMFDPSPNVPRHMEAVHKLLDSKNTSAFKGPLPAHAECGSSCAQYWNHVIRNDANASKLLYYPLGLADTDGNMTFYGYAGMTGAGSWSLDPSMRSQNAPKVEVPVKTFATLSRELGFEALDIVKIDVEGMETKIIDQLFQMPKEFLPRLIFVDFDSLAACKGTAKQCKENAKKGHETLNKLKAEGYHAINPINQIEIAFFKSDSKQQ